MRVRGSFYMAKQGFQGGSSKSPRKGKPSPNRLNVVAKRRKQPILEPLKPKYTQGKRTVESDLRTNANASDAVRLSQVSQNESPVDTVVQAGDPCVRVSRRRVPHVAR